MMSFLARIADHTDIALAVAVLIEHGEHGSWAAPFAKQMIEAYLGKKKEVSE